MSQNPKWAQQNLRKLAVNPESYSRFIENIRPYLTGAKTSPFMSSKLRFTESEVDVLKQDLLQRLPEIEQTIVDTVVDDLSGWRYFDKDDKGLIKEPIVPIELRQDKASKQFALFLVRVMARILLTPTSRVIEGKLVLQDGTQQTVKLTRYRYSASQRAKMSSLLSRVHWDPSWTADALSELKTKVKSRLSFSLSSAVDETQSSPEVSQALKENSEVLRNLGVN